MPTYREFVKEQYPKVKKSNPSLKATEIIKKIAEMWRSKK